MPRDRSALPARMPSDKGLSLNCLRNRKPIFSLGHSQGFQLAGMAAPLYRRLAEPSLIDALKGTPVVLVHGPRQCGKTTLAQRVGKRRGYRYYTFDDATTLAAARADITGFVARLERRAILDEVQRVPEMFAALKPLIDANRKSVRFILTGSSDILLVPRLSDSLAGRMEMIRLFASAQVEIARRPASFLDIAFAHVQDFQHDRTLGKQLAERIVRGGYPVVQKRTANRRDAWYANYIETLIQRDVRDLAHIGNLDALPKLVSPDRHENAGSHGSADSRHRWDTPHQSNILRLLEPLSRDQDRLQRLAMTRSKGVL